MQEVQCAGSVMGVHSTALIWGAGQSMVLNDQFGSEMEELTKAKKLKQSKVRKEWESVGNKQGRGNVDDGPTEVKNDMASMTENVAMEHLEVEGPWKRIQTQWGVYEDEQKKLAKLKREGKKM